MVDKVEITTFSVSPVSKADELQAYNRLTEMVQGLANEFVYSPPFAFGFMDWKFRRRNSDRNAAPAHTRRKTAGSD